LLRQRSLDVFSHTIIWQIAATGDLAFSFKGYNGKNVPSLVEYLLRQYPYDHEVAIYEAAQYPVCEPVIRRIKLAELTHQMMSGISTLYVPPKEKPPVHLGMLKRLGLTSMLKGKSLVPVDRLRES